MAGGAVGRDCREGVLIAKRLSKDIKETLRARTTYDSSLNLCSAVGRAGPIGRNAAVFAQLDVVPPMNSDDPSETLAI